MRDNSHCTGRIAAANTFTPPSRVMSSGRGRPGRPRFLRPGRLRCKRRRATSAGPSSVDMEYFHDSVVVMRPRRIERELPMLSSMNGYEAINVADPLLGDTPLPPAERLTLLHRLLGEPACRQL